MINEQKLNVFKQKRNENPKQENSKDLNYTNYSYKDFNLMTSCQTISKIFDKEKS